LAVFAASRVYGRGDEKPGGAVGAPPAIATSEMVGGEWDYRPRNQLGQEATLWLSVGTRPRCQLADELDASTNPESATFEGIPPAQLERLVTDTIAAARHFDGATQQNLEDLECSIMRGTRACSPMLTGGTIQPVQDVMASWSVYAA
jgi:hypothetical protein